MTCKTNPSRISGYQVKIINNEMFVRVFYHSMGSGIFYKKDEILFVNKRNKFSVAGFINEQYKINNQYEFILEYCEINEYLHWKQTSNIFENISNVNPTIIHSNYSTFHGLALSSSGLTVIDGSPGEGNWFYAIGAKQAASGIIPGPFVVVNGKTEYEITRIVSLWMKIQNQEIIKSLPILPHICTLSANHASPKNYIFITMLMCS